MREPRRAGASLVVLLLLALQAASASEPAETAPAEDAAADSAPAPQLDWRRGPGTFPIGDGLAEIDLGENFVLLDSENTHRFMELNQNPVSENEVATLASTSDAERWFVVLEWDPIGYVEDSESKSLDADAILASIREGTKSANDERQKRGWARFEIVGWHEKPHYEEKTHNLSWAIIGESEDHRTVNRMVKLLGRRGVMTATLVASPEELDTAIAQVDQLLTGYRFLPGSTYAEFVPGKDTIAEVGLTALIAGGAGAALVKSGLLAKFWKLIVAAGVGAAAFVRRVFRGERAGENEPTRIG